MIDQKEAVLQWQRYVMEGKKQELVRPLVREAWDRCLKMRVDPSDGIGRILDEHALKKRQEKNRRLIGIATPIMQNLFETIRKTSFSIILTDSEGVLLYVLENDNIERKHKNLNFVAGTYWNEANVGSNAIGTALATDQAVQMVGAEHFCVTHHGWTCSAAPIHDEAGQIIGCLDFSGRVEDAQPHTFGMVTSAVEIIEKQWILENSKELMDTALNAILDGMLIVDRAGDITFMNRKMEEILFGGDEEKNPPKTFDEIFGHIDLNERLYRDKRPLRYADYSFTFHGRKVECLLNISPITASQKIQGAVVYVKEARQVRRVVGQIAGYRSNFSFRDILTEDPKMQQIIAFAKRIAVTDSTVLITGESGTGKELFAQALHARSHRYKEPFVALNCAALPRDLVEAELFGYEKGAFTGAVKEGKPGKFELADGGTLFLDEIGELPLDLQSKLLRFLDDHKVSRIGSTHERVIDVRIVAATNRDLEEEIGRKTFRPDLYYRLNVINLCLPPLRERRDDILLLARDTLEKLNRRLEEEKVLHPSFEKELEGGAWPGNVRQLQNAVQRAFYATQGREIVARDHDTASRSDQQTLDQPLASLEKKAMIAALRQTEGDVIRAARKLGIGKSTMYRKIKDFSIDLDPFRH